QGTAGGDGVADAEVLGRDFGVGLEGVKVLVFVFGASDANVAGDVGAIQVARDRANEESRAGEFGGERGGGRAESGQEIVEVAGFQADAQQAARAGADGAGEFGA